MPAWNNGAVITMTDFVEAFEYVVVRPGRPASRAIRIPFANIVAARCDFCPAVPLDNGRWLMGASPDTTYRLIEFGPDGRPIRNWTRPIERPRRRTDAELAELTVTLMRPPGGSNSPEGRPQAPDAERFRYPPRISGLDRDGAGRIWVHAQHAGTTHGAFDIFAPAGAYLATVRFREPIRGFAIGGEWMVAWGEDENGEPALWRYRIGSR
jgi:hypothetical protein